MEDVDKLLEEIEINDKIEYRKHVSASSLAELTEESLTDEDDELHNYDNMSVEEDNEFDDEEEKVARKLRRSLQALEALEEEDEEDSVAFDGEGEIVYDHNAARPDYKLFSLRSGSCLDYH